MSLLGGERMTKKIIHITYILYIQLYILLTCRTRWTSYVASTGDVRNAYENLIRKTE
jgi:hypothetical protein